MEKKSSAESTFLNELFLALNDAKIEYAVMRNYEHLPYSTRGSDLDLIAPGQEAARVKAVVLDSIRKAHGISIGVCETVGFFKVFALGRDPEALHSWWGLRLDVNFGLFYRGNRLLDGDGILPYKMHNGIRVLSSRFAGVLGVLKEVLNNRKFPSRYARHARLAALQEWDWIGPLLLPMGHSAIELFHGLLLSNGNSDTVRAECLKVQRALLRHVFIRQPLTGIRRHLSYQWARSRRYLRPPGVVAAILGVDGAGKSTVIKEILPALKAATHNAVFVQHLRPGVLPPLARFRGGEKAQVGPATEPHGSAPSGAVGSFLRIVYLMADYILGYWLLVRPKIAKQPAVFLFDRYAYDMAIDPRRFRIGLPGKSFAWLASLAPKPDIIICLHAPSDVIAARKSELPKSETERQLSSLRIFAEKEPRAVLIDTNAPVEEVKNRVLCALRDFCASRAGNSLRGE